MQTVPPNATMLKFGYPDTLVAQTDRWAVLVRPQQVTLGALVLACRERAVGSFSEVSAAGFQELRGVLGAVETLLRDFVSFEKINYLMLMMVDPDVHFHVFPRYRGERRFGDLVVPDRGWPGPPALGEAVAPDQGALARLAAELRSAWRGPAA